MLRVRVIVFGLRLAAALPAPLAYLLAAVIGEIGFRCNAHGRRIAVGHMRRVMGPRATRAQVVRAARGCFRSTAYYYAELARTPVMDPDRFIKQELALTGLEYLTKAVESGKGVICVSVHHGNPEYVSQCIAALGVHMVAVVEPLQPPELSRVVRSYRESQGHEFVDTGVPGTKRVLRHLRAGGLIAILTDRDIQGTGITVPFFGYPARIPTGAVELAMHTGAVMMPFVTRRLGPGRFQATLGPPLPLVRTGKRTEDVRRNTASLIATFEPYIRADPSQWFVISQPVWERACCLSKRETATERGGRTRRT